LVLSQGHASLVLESLLDRSSWPDVLLVDLLANLALLNATLDQFRDLLLGRREGPLLS
jgi:hypothetical protein